jgi:hypothetical protein
MRRFSSAATSAFRERPRIATVAAATKARDFIFILSGAAME